MANIQSNSLLCAKLYTDCVSCGVVAQVLLIEDSRAEQAGQASRLMRLTSLPACVHRMDLAAHIKRDSGVSLLSGL